MAITLSVTPDALRGYLKATLSPRFEVVDVGSGGLDARITDGKDGYWLTLRPGLVNRRPGLQDVKLSADYVQVGHYLENLAR